MKEYHPRKSKYGLNEMEVGESRPFATPTAQDKRALRRSAHNMNKRTDRYFRTRTLEAGHITVTRMR